MQVLGLILAILLGATIGALLEKEVARDQVERATTCPVLVKKVEAQSDLCMDALRLCKDLVKEQKERCQ